MRIRFAEWFSVSAEFQRSPMSFPPEIERTLADQLEALKFGPVEEYRDDISLTSLRHYRTKLLCKTHGGPQPVVDIVPGTQSVTLECGCTREIGERTKRTQRGRVRYWPGYEKVRAAA